MAPNAVAQCLPEFLPAPATDSVLLVRRDIGGTEGAKGRIESEAAHGIGAMLGVPMTAVAVGALEEILASRNGSYVGGACVRDDSNCTCQYQPGEKRWSIHGCNSRSDRDARQSQFRGSGDWLCDGTESVFLPLRGRETKSFERMRRIPGNRLSLWLGAGGRKGKYQRFGRVVRNAPGHLVVFLVDMSKEHRHVLVGRHDVDRLDRVCGRPIPARIQVEQGAMREDDDRLRLVVPGQIGVHPLQLVFADQSIGIRDVVERNKMHALMIEAVVARSEHVSVHLAVVETGVVLARNEAHVLDLEAGDNGLEFRHSLVTYLVVGRSMGEVARPDDDIGLAFECVYRGNGAFEGVLGLGVGRSFES